MSFDQQREIARAATEAVKGLGFDHLIVKAQTVRTSAVRIAQSAVCRENVALSETIFRVAGMWKGRESLLSTQARDAQELVAKIKTLRQEIELQAEDKESVLPSAPSGAFSWKPARAPFEALYAPELLYPTIAAHAARVRAQGLRMTGYVEARETRAHSFSTTGFALETHDHGVTISVTVDDQRSGAVGAAARASVHAEPAALDKLFGEATDEALQTCKTSGSPVELAPGDYTVVLHPLAAQDILYTALAYGLFDRRKIDEGRTYLAGKTQELRFPEQLALTQTLALALPDGGRYADAPFNHRGVPCESLDLIKGGRIAELYTSAFWAKKNGLRETFQPGQSPLSLAAAAPNGPKTLADLIAGTETGVYVANTWYLRMVSEMEGVITGMTRDGLYEIKDGKIGRPLLNMRWHENPIRVLQAVQGASSERMLFGRSRLAGTGRVPLTAMPALKVDGFHFSSVTKF